MISTGNDIVALQATQPEKTNLSRFYSRILTIDEKKLYDQLDCQQQAFDNCPQPHHPPLAFDQYVWLCWSIKESAFKFIRRTTPDLVFAPLRITIVQLIPPDDTAYYRCRISCSQGSLYSRSILRDGVIMTIVSEDEQFADTHWGFQPIGSSAYADQSASVRTFALRHLGTALSRDDLQVQKDPSGCPIVLAGGQKLAVPLSLAHHGNYVAWSFCC